MKTLGVGSKPNLGESHSRPHTWAPSPGCAWMPANIAENCFHEAGQGPGAPRLQDRTGDWCGPAIHHPEAHLEGGGRDERRTGEPQAHSPSQEPRMLANEQ